jgi:hypothetical protein
MKTKILEHDISWYVQNESVIKLDDTTEAHIMECINNGITSGEICMTLDIEPEEDSDEEEIYGWWEIVNWKDIACELHNAILSRNGNIQEKAIKRYNENWI